MQGVDFEDVKELLNYRKVFDFVVDYVFSQGTIAEGDHSLKDKKQHWRAVSIHPLESLLVREKGFNIQEYEALCSGINRRSLQRDHYARRN